MKSLITLLAIPLAVELANVVVHHFVRDNAPGINALDVISLCVTAAVVFFVGWTVVRRLGRVGMALAGGISIWVISVVAVSLLIGVEAVLRPRPGEDALVLKGFLISTLLAIPVVIVVSAIGAFLGRTTRRPTG